jgi:hypothetical protein
LSEWIAKNTFHENKKFSYKHREYQALIIDDPVKTMYVVKCAQVGLSEIFARWILATVATQDNFTAIYTFPAATDAELFTKSRLMPIIASSKAIQHSISKVVNSVDLKQFGQNSFLYTRGTYSETGALSVPADLIVHDEYDRSDMGNISAYVSRLQAKPTKMRRIFSTPTVAKYGIDLESRTSKRKKQIWTCSKCNHKFLPSYHEHVVIPGYYEEKRLLNKSNIGQSRWREAKLLCPKCGREPSQELKYREWVVENPTESYDSLTYFISPFCAPAFITPSYLVNASTEFAKWSEFVNQALGETAEDSEDTLTEEDIRGALLQGDLTSSDLHFMGVDLGLMCHITVGRISEGKLLVVHRESVFYTSLESKRVELCLRFNVLVSVHDLFPYTDIVTRVVNADPNAFGAIYVEKKSTETHTIKDQVADAEEGKLNVRSAMINRNIAFDELMAEFKAKRIVVQSGPKDDEFVSHLRSMKRIQKFTKTQEMKYVWEKTDGIDHYHHSLLYLYVATKLRGVAGVWSTPGAVPFVSAFRMGVQTGESIRKPVFL